jgi:hypothetical protein
LTGPTAADEMCLESEPMKRLNHANDCSGSRSRGTRLPFTAMLAVLAGTALSNSVQAQSTEPFPAAFELSSLLPENGGDGSDGFVLKGIGFDNNTGWSVSSAGDFNGDGFDDVIIGAWYASPNGIRSGESYVVFGRDLSPCLPDLNADGIVDQGDIQAFIAEFLEGC